MSEIDGINDLKRETIARMFSEHRSALKRMVAFRMDPRLVRRVDPSDVLQEAYVDASARAEHFRSSQTSAYQWLRQITEQTLIGVHRRHLGAQCRDIRRDAGQASPATSACIVAQLAGRLSSPSHLASRRELRATLEKAIEGMAPIDREVLALRHFEELGNKEIADLLGIQPSTAYNRYFRALERLRDILSQIPEFSEEVD